MTLLHYALFITILAAFTTGERINLQEMPQGDCAPCKPPPSAIGPCNLDTSQCASDDPNCGTYDSTCYCQQIDQLDCAWSCEWWDWMIVEDWFFKQCPQAPTVDFKKAPKCAAACLEEKVIDYGCLTKNSNCFCIHADLFNCNYKCKGKEKDQLKTWLMDSCRVSEAQAQAGVTSSGFSQGAVDEGEAYGGDRTEPIFTARKRRKLRWYEGMAIALLIASVIAVLWFFGWMRFSERKHRNRHGTGWSTDEKHA